MKLSIIPVVIAAMHGDLSSDLAAHETRRMHVRIGGPVPERVEEAGEVMLIEGLIVGGHVQCKEGPIQSGTVLAQLRPKSPVCTIGLRWHFVESRKVRTKNNAVVIISCQREAECWGTSSAANRNLFMSISFPL